MGPAGLCPKHPISVCGIISPSGGGTAETLEAYAIEAAKTRDIESKTANDAPQQESEAEPNATTAPSVMARLPQLSPLMKRNALPALSPVNGGTLPPLSTVSGGRNSLSPPLSPISPRGFS